VVSPTERGHGYHAPAEGYKPSMQQTASGIYLQLFGGSDVNTPGTQHYVEWLRNHYRYTNLDSMGNSWPTSSYGYYLWSSFKGMELIRQSGIAPVPGNVGPNDLGTLPADATCNVREVNRDPTTLSRPALFGAGGPGYYSAESMGQYFDYAYTIINMQCASGHFTCTGYPGAWTGTSHDAYALLVLQRATGVVVQRCDVNGDGEIDTRDLNLIRAAIGTAVGANDVKDSVPDGIITMNDVRACTLVCTNARCVP
jgi:hypothetical protein